MSQLSRFIIAEGPGSGTVTSISAGTGITLTPNPITTTGTVALTIPVSIADGGTNATSMANTDGVVYYDGTRLVTTTVGTATYVLTSNGAGMAPTFQSASASGAVLTLTGNSGGEVSPAAGNIDILWGTSNGTGTIIGTPLTNTLTISTSDSNNNTGFGLNALVGLSGGSRNSAFGQGSLAAVTSGIANTAVGYQAGNAMTSNSANTFVGSLAGVLSTGEANTIIGALASSGGETSGSYNIIIGYDAGDNYTSSESSNILIGNGGIVSESNVIRIGTQGSGNGEQNTCYIAGIYGVNVGSVASVTSVISGGQLGSTVITAGTGISVTPGANTITIAATGTTTLHYTSVNHAASPYTVLAADDFIGVDSSGGVVSILLPNAPATGRVYTIKDSTGSAATNNITVTTVGGAVNIDGATSFVLNTNYEAIDVLFDGSTFQVF